MDMYNIMSNSLCRHCKNKTKRVISTEGLPIFDEDATSGDDVDFVLPEDASDFEQYACSVFLYRP